MNACRSCKAPIRWARMVGTDRAMPLDESPDPARGTIRLLSDGRGEVVSERDRKVLRESAVPLYVSHFATCSDPEKYRK